MKISQNTVVKLEWTLAVDDHIIERTPEGETQTILIGHAHGLPPKLESLLHGLEAGADVTRNVSAHDAYGEYDPNQVHTVPRSSFPAGKPLEVGSAFYTQDAQVQPLTARVTALDVDIATVDFNHPHAGKPLHYTIHIHKVRAAEAEELEHGHVHGEGGVTHHHHH